MLFICDNDKVWIAFYIFLNYSDFNQIYRYDFDGSNHSQKLFDFTNQFTPFAVIPILHTSDTPSEFTQFV